MRDKFSVVMAHTRVSLTQRVTTPPPAHNLSDAVKLCDPQMPLDPENDQALRADLDPSRGGPRLNRILRNIRRSGTRASLHFLSGHFGCGKTTELLRLKARLEGGDGGYAPATVVLVDADDMLDRNDIDLEDLLVALWASVFELDRPAAVEVLSGVWKQQLREILVGTVASLPEQGAEAFRRLVADVKVASPESRMKLRAALGPMTRPLIEGLNRALATLSRRFPNDVEGPVVVLIDNLEKMNQARIELVENLFIERIGALRELDAHLVITAPLYLCHGASGASLEGRHGAETIVLPMVKVNHRKAERTTDPPAGFEALTELLLRRVDFGTLFLDGREAAEEIVLASGGCIRDALRMTLDAINEHDDPPVSRESVRRSIASLRATYERALPEAYVRYLKVIATHNAFPEDCPAEIKRDLLRNLFVLEYQNGDPDPWYGVHPLVEGCRKFLEPPVPTESVGKPAS